MRFADHRLVRAACVFGGILLIAACNNRLPPPPPVPDQPLTDAQLYEQKKQRYRQEKDSRRRSVFEERRVEFVRP